MRRTDRPQTLVRLVRIHSAPLAYLTVRYFECALPGLRRSPSLGRITVRRTLAKPTPSGPDTQPESAIEAPQEAPRKAPQEAPRKRPGRSLLAARLKRPGRHPRLGSMGVINVIAMWRGLLLGWGCYDPIADAVPVD